MTPRSPLFLLFLGALTAQQLPPHYDPLGHFPRGALDDQGRSSSPLDPDTLLLPDPSPIRSTPRRLLGGISRQHLAHKIPKNALLALNRGLQAARKGRPEDAIEHFIEATRLDPNYWEAHAHLADLYWQKGEQAKALQELETAITIDPNSESLQLNKAVALLALGRLDEAEVAARRALQFAPVSTEARYLLGMALLRQGKLTEETVAHLAAAARKYPEAKAAYNLAQTIFAADSQSTRLTQSR